MDFSDLLDAFPEGWRPKSGDKLIGVVIGLEERTTDYGAYPILTARTADGKDVAVHAYHTVLRRELEKADPKVGDKIGIAYHGPHPERGYERYRVVLQRGTGSPPPGSEPESGPASPRDDDIPFSPTV